MKQQIGAAFLFATLLPAVAWSADLGANGTTLFRFQQQSAPGSAKKTLAPATQYLGVDAGSLADGNLSFHLYGWGRVDMGDESPVNGTSSGDVTYGYLDYRFPKANGQIRAGRFFVSEGVASETIDGVSVHADLLQQYEGLSISLYAGAPANAITDIANNARGNYLTGGRLSYHLPIGELGISALLAGDSPSRRPVGGVLQTVEESRRLIGADIRLAPLPMLELNGRTSYNTATSSTAEHDYTVLVKAAKNVTVTGSFVERRMLGLYSGTNLPLLFAQYADDKVRVYGLSATMAVAKPLELTADYRHTRRDTFGSSDRYGVDARVSLPEWKLTGGAGYHRVDTGNTPLPAGSVIPRYNLAHHELRGWVSTSINNYTASLDAIGYFFDDTNNPNLYGKSSASELIASVGYRALPNLTISGEASYGANPLYTSEFKGLLRAEYSFSVAGKGGK